MSETRTYAGGCHCGSVRFEVTTDLDRVVECNCSHCSRKGFLLSFVDVDRFSLLGGEDQLSDYFFAKKRVRHRFCSRCGIQAFSTGQKPDGSRIVAVNVRCLDHIDPARLTVAPFDGRSL